MKNKKKNKMFKMFLKFYVWGVAIFLTAALLDWTIYQIIFFVLDPVKQFETAEVNIIRKAEAVEGKDDMREWVLNQFRINNLNPQIADCVINQESRWNDQVLPSSTNDYGLMQWNIMHIKSGLLTMGCAYDYRCSVQKAIVKIKKDQSWQAWAGYKNGNCQRFGKL